MARVTSKNMTIDSRHELRAQATRRRGRRKGFAHDSAMAWSLVTLEKPIETTWHFALDSFTTGAEAPACHVTSHYHITVTTYPILKQH